MFNDVVVGTPIGLSSLVYLLICGAAAYLKNITLRPNLLKDWIFFLLTILTINSIYLLILTIIFDYEVIIFNQMINIIFTFIFYPFFIYSFSFVRKVLIGSY